MPEGANNICYKYSPNVHDIFCNSYTDMADRS